ncbi:MAG: alginate export family protein [Candidatus Hydrogenedentes bacterium]|nr:alginate export family protein [Candidatus Hydrogenedentota bacterium]
MKGSTVGSRRSIVGMLLTGMALGAILHFGLCAVGSLTPVGQMASFAGVVDAQAELQNVTVGGEIRLRARYWHNVYDDTLPGGLSLDRVPTFFLPRRPIGLGGTRSRYIFDERVTDREIVEQKTLLNVNADFTNHVNATIVVESFDLWGDDFRSDYITGADFRANTGTDVEITQSFIDVENLFDTPLTLRIGRQPLAIDKRWLVSDYISGTLAITFDGVRLMYHGDLWEIDAWATKLAEGGVGEQDGDVDFYGAHATFKPFDWLNATAYYFLVRDGRSLNDTNASAPVEWFEDFFGRDNYDPTYLHTIGTRLRGEAMGWDYDIEAAYQFGEMDAVGSRFVPNGFAYGDDSARMDAWGVDVEVGHTFENIFMKPRVKVGGAWMSGEDNREVDFLDWINPIDRPDSSMSFNRLFSGTVYSWTLDVGQDMSNFKHIRVGAETQLTESVTASITATKWWVDEPFEMPAMWKVGRFRVPLAPALSFLSEEGSDDIGTTVLLWLRYNYSEDFYIALGVEHLFTGDALEDGSFLHRNGLEFTGGLNGDDGTYFVIDSGIKFGGPGRAVDLHQIEYRTKK